MIYFPFDSINGDRNANSKGLAGWISTLAGNGIVGELEDRCKVLSNSSMDLTVKLGPILINGHSAIPEDGDTDESIPAPLVPGKYRVIKRLNLNQSKRIIETLIIKGSDSEYPVLVRTSSQWDLCLAQYTLTSSMSFISQNDLIDTRSDSDLCGTVKNLDITVDEIMTAANRIIPHYGICTTAGATAAKIATVPDVTSLQTGNRYDIKFSYANTAPSPTLNINGFGAIPMPETGYLNGNVIPLRYNGSSFEYVGAVFTPKYIGAAPAGYGLGENLGKLITDCNAATESGYYRMIPGGANSPDNAAYIDIHTVVYDSNFAFQEAVSHLGNWYRRYKEAGVWKAWVCESGDLLFEGNVSSGTIITGINLADYEKIDVYHGSRTNGSVSTFSINKSASGSVSFKIHSNAYGMTYNPSSSIQGVMLKYESTTLNYNTTSKTLSFSDNSRRNLMSTTSVSWVEEYDVSSGLRSVTKIIGYKYA